MLEVGSRVSTKVHLYSGLKEFTNGHSVVEVYGGTVGECLAALVEQFPGIKQELFDSDGSLSGRVLVSVNLESAYPEGLTNPVESGDELYVVRIMAGG